ncbi:hypothetical protein RhiirA4_424777 [Rhizophagus irregularis]|uniref:Uncharacterized protein n=1 Tax=Rhizophagus irregularis TaxID=588596 RepID=A0A2I1GYU9_9GLOM|nr:hypothetical protein RhiirA4_424777 [Rhizophagus irregularis]
MGYKSKKSKKSKKKISKTQLDFSNNSDSEGLDYETKTFSPDLEDDNDNLMVDDRNFNINTPIDKSNDDQDWTITESSGCVITGHTPTDEARREHKLIGYFERSQKTEKTQLNSKNSKKKPEEMKSKKSDEQKNKKKDKSRNQLFPLENQNGQNERNFTKLEYTNVLYEIGRCHLLLSYYTLNSLKESRVHDLIIYLFH